MKTVLPNSYVVLYSRFLYQRKGKEKDLTALMKGNELVVATPAEQESVRTCAADFMSAIFFDRRQVIHRISCRLIRSLFIRFLS